nr:hypothetical protein [Tanacetum cinerariifolium]
MGVEVEQDDLNQKFLTSLDPEWLMHTIVWRNWSDLDTMSLDDLYNHLKDYEEEVQKKSEPNTQNMAFISSTKHSRGNDEVNAASVYTASIIFPTASSNVATVSISQETACAYIASQSDKFWKKTWKNISIQGLDVAGFDKLKVECFNCHKMGHFAKECRAPRNQEREEGETLTDREDHALVTEAPIEFALMANTTTENKVFDNSLCSKDCKKNNDSMNSKIIDLTDKLFDANNMIYHYKLALAQLESRLVEYKEKEVKYIEKIRTLEFYDKGLLSASKDLDNLIESQRSDKSKEGLGYTAVPPPVAQLYLSLKKDLFWTGLPECADDTVTDYSRPLPTVESSSEEDQNINPSASENVASPIT